MSGSRPVEATEEPQVRKVRKTSRARIVEIVDAPQDLAESQSGIPAVYVRQSNEAKAKASASLQKQQRRATTMTRLRSLFCCFPCKGAQNKSDDQAPLLDLNDRPANSR